MSKIYDCSKCDACMHWACPIEITSDNYEYAKSCLESLKRTFVCGCTNKVKHIGNKQQCSHFSDEMFHGGLEALYLKNIEKIEENINAYEDTLN